MKPLAFYGLLGALTLIGSSPCAFAQKSLEMAGGPTSVVTQTELNSIRMLSTNIKNDITRLLDKAKSQRDPSEMKKTLTTGMEGLVQACGTKMNDMLLKHSLIAGLNISRLIQSQTIERGLSRTPQGIVRQQVRVLRHALEMASRYYQKDQDYLNAVVTHTVRDTQWAAYGLELSQFIIKMSDGVLSAPAAYGMIRWSLGVLEKNLMNDVNRPAFHDAIMHLHEDLAKMPNIMVGDPAPNDLDCIAKIRQLKFIAREAAKDLAFEMKELGKI